jgi:hypothetical protein
MEEVASKLWVSHPQLYRWAKDQRPSENKLKAVLTRALQLGWEVPEDLLAYLASKDALPAGKLVEVPAYPEAPFLALLQKWYVRRGASSWSSIADELGVVDVSTLRRWSMGFSRPSPNLMQAVLMRAARLGWEVPADLLPSFKTVDLGESVTVEALQREVAELRSALQQKQEELSRSWTEVLTWRRAARVAREALAPWGLGTQYDDSR